MTPDSTSPLSTLRLRCPSCGAAYLRPAEGEILTCTYCGTSQRTVDAREFLDHFMAQVTAFVRQAIPSGIDVGHAENVDPVARLSAFNSSVRPRLTTESEQLRFNCFNLLATPLALLPFSTVTVPGNNADPTSISVFAAKVQSVSGLAVDPTSKDLLARAGGLASAYQSLLVATRLMKTVRPERYALIVENLDTASKALESTGRWSSLGIRLSGLADACRAIDLWLSAGKIGESEGLLGSAVTKLTDSRGKIASAPDLGYMLPSVDQELAVCRAIGSILRISRHSPNVSPPPLLLIQRLVGILDWLGSTAPGSWAAVYRSAALREGVLARAERLRLAQAGIQGVRVAQIGAGALLPFWMVQLPYTFETGALWAKRGKEVAETLLVSALFPTDIASLSGQGCVRVLSDVFGATAQGGSLSQYYNKVRGKEARISDSSPILPVLQSISETPIPGRPAVPPVTTEAEALKQVQTYLELVRTSNPKAAEQLRASSPRVLDLVYIPGVPGAAPPVSVLGPLSPATVGLPDLVTGFLA